MRRIGAIFVVAVSMFAAIEVRAEPQCYLLLGAKVLDADGLRLLDGQAVLVADGKIAQISPPSAIKPPSGLTPTRIDLTGSTLLPGLIDLHSHLLLHPYNEAPWNVQVLFETLEDRTIRATVAARNTLMAGFTTLRDLGTEGAGFADVALRESIRQDLIPGPRLYVVTRAIVARGCYGPTSFDSRREFPQGAQEANGADGVRAAVRDQVAHGADWIKVYADYSRGLDTEATPTFSQDELNALVDEARSAHRLVAAHATTDEGIRRAVLAGVKTIEHGYGISEATLKLMKERGVVLCPTLTASDAVARYAGWNGKDPAPPRVAKARAAFKAAMRTGVTIANGSDVGVFAHGENARELELMVACGMSRADAIRAATITAAQVVGREADLGRIKSGYLADLLAVRGNPLEDIKSLRHVVLVCSRGKIVLQPQAKGIP